MAFRSIAALAEIIADDIQQVIDALTGVVGRGQAISMTQLNDSTAYALQVRQNDTSTGWIAKFMRDGNQAILDLLRTGALISPDGLTTAPPVTTSHIQTLTNKTLGYFKWTRGSTTASTGTLTLPTDGNLIPISGTVTITAINAHAAGALMCLEFASPACIVKAGSTLRLQGDFISAAAGATLILECDGTNWNEIGRGTFRTPGARYYISAATQSITSGAQRTVSWTASEWNYGLTPVTTSAIVPGILGRWHVDVSIIRDVAESSAVRGWFMKNGSNIRQILVDDVPGGGPDDPTYYASFNIDVTSVSDNYGVGLISGNTGNIIGLTDGCSLEFTYLGR